MAVVQKAIQLVQLEQYLHLSVEVLTAFVPSEQHFLGLEEESILLLDLKNPILSIQLVQCLYWSEGALVQLAQCLNSSAQEMTALVPLKQRFVGSEQIVLMQLV